MREETITYEKKPLTTPARRRMTIVAAIVGVSSSFLQARSLNTPLLREVGEISRNLDNAQRLATYVWCCEVSLCVAVASIVSRGTC